MCLCILSFVCGNLDFKCTDYVKTEVLMAANMNINVPCGLLEVYRRFRGSFVNYGMTYSVTAQRRMFCLDYTDGYSAYDTRHVTM